jgi:poly(A) polymerase
MNTISLSFPYPEIIEKILINVPEDINIYLVGGTVRDILLSRPIHDLDFVLSGRTLEIGRRVANSLNAAFYPLDPERGTARVILTLTNNERLVMDFATYQGDNLEQDLLARDFTINSMAIPLRPPYKTVDMLGGVNDLQKGIIRASSKTSFLDDPLRVLRCVRLSVGFGFRILPETLQYLRESISQITNVSIERIRDEVFRILEGRDPHTAFRILEHLGVLEYIFPELTALKGTQQSPPHHEDVWIHSLKVMSKLNMVINLLSLQPAADSSENWISGTIIFHLGKFRQQINQHLNSTPNADRSLRALLLFASIYHDSGKPLTQKIEADGKIRFLNHENVGAQAANQRARYLHLSNPEIDRVTTIVQQHMRPILLAQSNSLPTQRAIYRYYRSCRDAGVDICLLSLADTLATYGFELQPEAWTRQLDTVRILLEAWWEHPKERVSPPILVTGHDLMDQFALEPGPEIGRLLELIRESQASGELSTRKEAMEFAAAQVKDI